MQRLALLIGLLAPLAVAGALALALQAREGDGGAPIRTTISDAGAPPLAAPQPVNGPHYPPVPFRASKAVGLPHAGRLIRATRLPARGRGFTTWDPITRDSPSRGWRRNGTDTLVGMVVRVARRYRAAEPRELPMLVGDLSRPRGGNFGPQYGFIGHSTHQNGRDVDVYYPRRDGRPGVPKTPAQVNHRLAQRLVDLFVAAGAETVLVGPNVSLKGPPGVVKRYPNHDNHLHVRIADPD